MTYPHDRSRPGENAAGHLAEYAAAHEDAGADESGPVPGRPGSGAAGPVGAGSGVAGPGAHSRPVPLHERGPSGGRDDPDRIRRDIERTQDELSSDISAVADKLNPGRVVEDRLDDVRAAAGRLRERVNPLAAGVVAFGLGWLVSSLVPAHERERRLAEQARAKAAGHAEPVIGAARKVAGEVRDGLAEPARDAVDSVRATAGDSADSVRSTAEGSARAVADEARSAATEVRDAATETRNA